ncbi:mitochondrial large subunit ribosomal protein-domain-containing protein [Xylariales sp. AK1849]|nr:mitochondrial large subunit ribosomal protein-domain-containing protein [Xylariales sp. AK1849]
MISRILRPLRAAAALRTTLPMRHITPISFRTLITESISTSSSSEPIILKSQETTFAGGNAPEAPETPAQAKIPKPPQQLPYFVGRNRLNNFSVYEKKMRGGSLKKTLLKNGEGDMQALRHDVAEILGLTKDAVKVNNVTKHIEVKGHRREHILLFLKNMGF